MKRESHAFYAWECQIDGFNLYFGLKSKGWHRYYWLDLQRLSKNILLPSQHLVFTKYFTARVDKPDDKRQRQSLFLEALRTLDDFEIFYGQYLTEVETCRSCGNRHPRYSEKMTDVNLAVELLADGCFHIGRANLAKSLFPEEVVKPDGFVLRCPPSWR